MSTEIKDRDRDYGPHLLYQFEAIDGALVNFNAKGTARVVPATMRRADFIDAIRTELNVIVIDKADLPEVERYTEGNPVLFSDGFVMGPVGNKNTAAWLGLMIRRYLALAEYLDAHPPVDEAQVEALAKIIRERYDETGDVTRYPTEHSLARRLVERGVRVETGEQS